MIAIIVLMVLIPILFILYVVFYILPHAKHTKCRKCGKFVDEIFSGTKYQRKYTCPICGSVREEIGCDK